MVSVLPASISFTQTPGAKGPRLVFEFVLVGHTTRSGRLEAQVHGLLGRSFRACEVECLSADYLTQYVEAAMVPAVCRILFQSRYGDESKEMVLTKFMKNPEKYPHFEIISSADGCSLRANAKKCDQSGCGSWVGSEILDLCSDIGLNFEINGMRASSKYFPDNFSRRFKSFASDHYYMTWGGEIVGLPREKDGLWTMGMAEGDRDRRWDDSGLSDASGDSIRYDLGDIEGVRDIIREAMATKVNFMGEYYGTKFGENIKEDTVEEMRRPTSKFVAALLGRP